MRGKIGRHPILLLGLVFLLASLVMLTSGCGQKTEVESPEVGPLESPFSEIIPTAEDLFIDLFNLSYSYSERTIYYPDGSVGYSRMFGNEAARYTPLSGEPKPEIPSVLLSMLIVEYQNEEQAKKRILEEKERRWYDESESEFYAKLYNLPLEDIVGRVNFWREPAVEEVQGREGIYFRVGRYVGYYALWVDDPPKLEDGYFMPPTLSDLLWETAVQITIPRLRSLQNL